MASGSFSTSFTPYNYELVVEWSSETDINNNSSTITANIYLDVVYTLRTSAHGGSSININGINYPFDSPTINADGDYVYIATVVSNPIPHNSNGKKTVSISCDYACNATISSVYYGTINASKSVELDQIPRQATISSATNFTDEENPTITYDNPAGGAVDALNASIYSEDGEWAYARYRVIDATASSYTFNLTDEERNAIRNAIPDSKSMSVRFYLQTIVGVNVYTTSIVKTVSIVNANPVFNPVVEDVDTTTLALTGDKNKLVKYYSDAKITIGASAIKGATLESSAVSNSGKTLEANGTFNNVESGIFNFTATDSRGNSASYQLEKPFVDYIKLTANFKPSITVDGEARVRISGNYFNNTFGAVSNTLSVSYRFKTSDGEYGEWVSLTPSIGYDTYDADTTFTIDNFDYRSSYCFQIKANDKLINIESEEYRIKALPVFDWGEDDFRFNVPIYLGNTQLTEEQLIRLLALI